MIKDFEIEWESHPKIVVPQQPSQTLTHEKTSCSLCNAECLLEKHSMSEKTNQLSQMCKIFFGTPHNGRIRDLVLYCSDALDVSVHYEIFYQEAMTSPFELLGLVNK